MESEGAVTLLTRLTGMIKYVNGEFKPILDKQNAAHKAILSLKTKILAPLEEAKRDLSQRNMAWRTAEQEKRETARREADEKAAKEVERRQAISDAAGERGQEQHEIAPVEVEEPAPFIDTTKTRANYCVRVIDKQLVPEEHKIVDLTKIRKLMLAAPRNESNEPVFDMPGIEVFNEPVPVYG